MQLRNLILLALFVRVPNGTLESPGYTNMIEWLGSNNIRARISKSGTDKKYTIVGFRLNSLPRKNTVAL